MSSGAPSYSSNRRWGAMRETEFFITENFRSAEDGVRREELQRIVDAYLRERLSAEKRV